MFKKLVRISFILVFGACQTSKNNDKKKEIQYDSKKFSSTGDLQYKKHPLTASIRMAATYAPEIQIKRGSAEGMIGGQYKVCYPTFDVKGCFRPEAQLEGLWHISNYRFIEGQNKIILQLKEVSGDMGVVKQDAKVVYELFATNSAQRISKKASWQKKAALLFEPLTASIRMAATYAPEIQIKRGSGEGMIGGQYEEGGYFRPEDQLEGRWHISNYRFIEGQNQIILQLKEVSGDMGVVKQGAKVVYELFVTDSAQRISKKASWQEKAALLFE